MIRTQLAAAALVAAAFIFTSCGPPADEAHVSVSQTDSPSAPSSPTVVEHETVVTQPPDTIVQEHTNTIIQQRTDTVIKTVPGTTTTVTVPPEEQVKIDAWLAAHADSLNQYGDPIDMVYAGGTPLFNEATGKRISKYEYIVSRHPDKPWTMATSSRRR